MHPALCAGAAGFLLKNSRPEQLAEALRAAAGGEPVLAPTVTRRLIDTVTALLPAATAPAPADGSPTEHEIQCRRWSRVARPAPGSPRTSA